MTDRPIIQIANVTKDFGPVRATNDVSVDIAHGEFFSLLGPSGCGKTTLLRMLAGFEAPTRGEIYIDGQPMSTVPAHQRPVNMVFQSYAIFPHLDVRGNIAFGMRKSGLSKTEINRLVEEMLEMIKLPGYGKRAAHQLSGGERQRVALARALIKRPKVLLLDEPLGALDKKLRAQMQIELRELQQSVGITFVFVTHDQEEALTMSDRIAVMSKGHVLQIDSPTGLYESPRNRFVADFIGTMNFFEGSLESLANGHATVDAGPLGRIKAAAEGAPGGPGSPIVVAIRPEKFQLSSSAPAGGGENVVEGRMGPSAYLGDRSHFYVHVAGRDEPIAVAAQNLEPSGGRIGPKEPVWLRWAARAVVLLPPE